MTGQLHLLGPQRPSPNMPSVLAHIPGHGRLVYVTAGWRLDENDDESLKADVGVDGFSLPLYAWFEELATEAPELFAAHHAQQDEIRKLKAVYRLRLDPAIESVKLLLQLKETKPESAFVNEELDDALGVLRRLRQRFVAHCDDIRQKFQSEHAPKEHPRMRRRLDEIDALLREARAVLIAGGHVGVLRNRLEFFGLGRLLADALARGVSVIAWSAGAMAMADEVVLFHDDPPTGQTTSEVLDRGLGLAAGVVVLPHARERLFLNDKQRVSLMAARFAPHLCIGMENGAWIQRQQGGWIDRGRAGTAYRLGDDGGLHPLGRADA